MRALAALFSCCSVLLTPAIAGAEERYRVLVTRKESDLYRVDGTSFWIRTSMCFEYAYSQDAVLVWHGRGSFSNELRFLDYDKEVKSKCRVEAVLVETEPS
jgi:hypothetical protein